MTNTLKPRDAKDAEAAVGLALAEGKTLEIVGQSSKRGIGRAAQWDLSLDLSDLSGVTLYTTSHRAAAADTCHGSAGRAVPFALCSSSYQVEIVLRRVVGTGPNQVFVDVTCRAKVTAATTERHPEAEAKSPTLSDRAPPPSRQWS